MTASDNNWPPVVGNLRKAQKNWVRMLRILGQEGSDPQTTGNFYKVVVQSTLLLGAESWLMPPLGLVGTWAGSTTRWPSGCKNAAEEGQDGWVDLSTA